MYHFNLSDDDIAAISTMLWPYLFEGMTDSSNTLVLKVIHEDSTTGSHPTADTDLLNFKETTCPHLANDDVYSSIKLFIPGEQSTI